MKKFGLFSILVFVLNCILISSAFSEGTLTGLVPGYDKWGSDIDECAINNHDCPSCMSCVNTEGSYECVARGPKCDDEHHRHDNVGGPPARPKPHIEDLPNKTNESVVFKPDSNEYGGGVTWNGKTYNINFSKKVRIIGSIVKVCDYGGSDNCYRGVRGIFTFSDGTMTEEFISFTN